MMRIYIYSSMIYIYIYIYKCIYIYTYGDHVYISKSTSIGCGFHVDDLNILGWWYFGIISVVQINQWILCGWFEYYMFGNDDHENQLGYLGVKPEGISVEYGRSSVYNCLFDIRISRSWTSGLPWIICDSLLSEKPILRIMSPLSHMARHS